MDVITPEALQERMRAQADQHKQVMAVYQYIRSEALTVTHKGILWELINVTISSYPESVNLQLLRIDGPGNGRFGVRRNSPLWQDLLTRVGYAI